MSRDFRIKQLQSAKLSDAQLTRLAQLWQQLDAAENSYDGKHGLEMVPSTEEGCRAFIQKADRGITAAVDKNDQILGFATNMPAREYKNVNYISALTVDENNRGKGIGRAILQSILRKNRSQKRKSMLCVSLNNPAGLHLYDSLGFTPVSQTMITTEKTAELEKSADFKRLLGLMRQFSKAERPVVSSLIRQAEPGVDRFRLMSAIRRAVKPEQWSSDKPHRLLRAISDDYKAGKPHVFRGSHNPTEPVHVTGKSVAEASPDTMDWSRSWVSGMHNHRHITPWPQIAHGYTRGNMGMHKVAPGRFAHIESYRAEDFPEIAANSRLDNFAEQYTGMTNAQARVKPQSLTSLARSDFEDRAEFLRDHPNSSLFRKRVRSMIEDFREDLADSGFGGLKGKSHKALRERIAGRAYNLRRQMLKQMGPMDQLKDKLVQDYALNRSRPGAHSMLYDYSKDDRFRDDYYNLYEMVTDLSKRRPATLTMVDTANPGRYYDTTGLMRLYNSFVDKGNSKGADLIKKLFNKRFGVTVE